MPWDDDLYEVIRRDFPVGQPFTLADVYAYEDHFQKLYPDNHHVRDKLRQVLQHLRETGVVEFLDEHGHYRRVS